MDPRCVAASSGRSAGRRDGRSGQCTTVPVPGCTGTGGDPCGTWTLPGSTDPAVQSCVCALDAFCCDDHWDGLCAELAASACGATCDCSALPPTARLCSADVDCQRCGAAAPCDGVWTCEDGTYQPGTPVTCDPTGTECTVSACNPDNGLCVTTTDLSACDDHDPCTVDVCDEGTCLNPAVDECGEGDPCYPHFEPGADGCSQQVGPVPYSDPIAACVCDSAPYCCGVAWDTACADVAASTCGASCPPPQ